MTRPKLSIQLLGVKKFYAGVTVGLLLSIILYLFLGYFSEVLRAQTFDSDLIIPTKEEFFVYNLFFAGVSVTVGFGVTVWFWFQALFSKQRSRVRINYISAYAMFWAMTLLYVVAKSGTLMTLVLFTMDEYDDDLNLAKEFPLLLFLLPTIFFLNIWTPIRLRYRSGNWLVISIGVVVIMTAGLASSSLIDHHTLNESWNKHMTPYNEIVDSEIRKANVKGIIFSEAALEIVRFNRRERMVKQAESLKKRFGDHRPIPTDSVVLELILIKKTTIWFLPKHTIDDMKNVWPFALPRHVYQQMKMSNDTIRNAYLRDILLEYKNIFDGDWSAWNNQDEVRANGLSGKYFNRNTLQRVYQGMKFELNYLSDHENEVHL